MMGPFKTYKLMYRFGAWVTKEKYAAESDIEAYLNIEGDCRYRNDHLVNATQTIVEMRKYWARIPDEVKPEWITEEQINKYDESSKSLR